MEIPLPGKAADSVREVSHGFSCLCTLWLRLVETSNCHSFMCLFTGVQAVLPHKGMPGFEPEGLRKMQQFSLRVQTCLHALLFSRKIQQSLPYWPWLHTSCWLCLFQWNGELCIYIKISGRGFCTTSFQTDKLASMENYSNHNAKQGLLTFLW